MAMVHQAAECDITITKGAQVDGGLIRMPLVMVICLI